MELAQNNDYLVSTVDTDGLVLWYQSINHQLPEHSPRRSDSPYIRWA